MAKGNKSASLKPQFNILW